MNIKKEDIESLRGLHVARLTFAPHVSLKEHAVEADDDLQVVVTHASIATDHHIGSGVRATA